MVRCRSVKLEIPILFLKEIGCSYDATGVCLPGAPTHHLEGANPLTTALHR